MQHDAPRPQVSPGCCCQVLTSPRMHLKPSCPVSSSSRCLGFSPTLQVTLELSPVSPRAPDTERAQTGPLPRPSHLLPDDVTPMAGCLGRTDITLRPHLSCLRRGQSACPCPVPPGLPTSPCAHCAPPRPTPTLAATTDPATYPCGGNTIFEKHKLELLFQRLPAHSPASSRSTGPRLGCALTLGP